MKRTLCLWLPQWPLQRIAAARAGLSGASGGDHGFGDRAGGDRAVVLYQLNAAGGAKVTAYAPRLATAAASGWLADRQGIRPGMPLAEATALAIRARHEADSSARFAGDVRGAEQGGAASWQSGLHRDAGLHCEAADPWADRLALEALADDCQRFAPSVGIEECERPDSLLLDVTGLGPLYGGETALVRRVIEDFQQRCLSVRAALAETPGAAWAVAHFAPLELAHGEVADETAILKALARPVIVPGKEAMRALAALPPAALRLEAETCGLLAELGIERIEQLAGLRRETLSARFGPRVLLRLDQALGHATEALVARAVPAEWTFEWLLEHPTGRREMIEWAVGQLITRVCQALARERRGVLRLACRFVPERGAAIELIVGLFRPSASERHVGELVRLKLEAVRFREPLVAIRFEVLALAALELEQQDFLSGLEETRDDERAVATLVDRLSNRLGAQNVVRPWLLAGAQPEFACQYQPVASLQNRRKAGRHAPARTARRTARAAAQMQAKQDLDASRGPTTPRPGERPLWLDSEPVALAVLSVVPDGPPIRFRLAGDDHRVERYWGPERIETGWWRTRCIRRDYYQVETHTGQRFWLFRELNSQKWFLQGAFL